MIQVEFTQRRGKTLYGRARYGYVTEDGLWICHRAVDEIWGENFESFSLLLTHEPRPGAVKIETGDYLEGHGLGVWVFRGQDLIYAGNFNEDRESDWVYETFGENSTFYATMIEKEKASE